MIGQQRNTSWYRRGLAFGLTLAETFIIIAFILLLLFARNFKRVRELEREDTLLKRASHSLRDQIESIKELIKLNERLQEENRSLRRAVESKSDDLFRELKLERERVAKLETELTETKREQEKYVQKIAEYEKELDEYKRDHATIETLSEKLSHAGFVKSREREKLVPELLARISESERERERLEGEVANLSKRLGGNGRGTVMPPCWTKPDGSIEYIFDITLTSQGILVHDNQLPERKEEEHQLVPSIKFDSPLSRDEFLRATVKLYEWERSRKPECRFFVRVHDQTAADEKQLYKEELQTVESRFYKLLVQDENDSADSD